MDQAQAAFVDLLEPLLQEFVSVAGLPATLLLVQQYGGRRLWFPYELEPTHPLAKLLGMAAARPLCRRFEGERLLIPKALPALKAVRDARIRANPDGLSVNELARVYSLGERQLYAIRATVDTQDPNLRLFD